eukprot:GHUV01046703.1.p1 GENE.GHUV01046703.1~~GHUV01046703.1.p1  ORF type:complete len:108 (-),score=9.77 GHUV01046703.1:172-495(-)
MIIQSMLDAGSGRIRSCSSYLSYSSAAFTFVCPSQTLCCLCQLCILQLTHNRSLDGVLDQLNSRHMTDAGPLQLINHNDADSDDELLPPGNARVWGGGRGSAGNCCG